MNSIQDRRLCRQSTRRSAQGPSVPWLMLPATPGTLIMIPINK